MRSCIGVIRCRGSVTVSGVMMASGGGVLAAGVARQRDLDFCHDCVRLPLVVDLREHPVAGLLLGQCLLEPAVRAAGVPPARCEPERQLVVEKRELRRAGVHGDTYGAVRVSGQRDLADVVADESHAGHGDSHGRRAGLERLARVRDRDPALGDGGSAAGGREVARRLEPRLAPGCGASHLKESGKALGVAEPAG